jgi:acyl carrier protein
MSNMTTSQIQIDLCSFVTSLTGHRCDPDSDFRALGVDSVAFLEIVIFLEKKLSIPLPLELITATSITTVSGLVAQLEPILSANQSGGA